MECHSGFMCQAALRSCNLDNVLFVPLAFEGSETCLSNSFSYFENQHCLKEMFNDADCFVWSRSRSCGSVFYTRGLSGV